jgi:transcriptional regulator with XRE-family HTH domain
MARKIAKYHAGLLAKQKELGLTQQQMATYLGTSLVTYARMLRLEQIPEFKNSQGKIFKQQLEELLGMTIEEIFPGHTFDEEFMEIDKSVHVTRDVPAHLLANAAMIHQPILPADEALMQEEEANHSQEAVNVILQLLPEREAAIMRTIYIEDRSLREAASILGIGHEGIRFIRNNILRCLRSFPKQRLLSRFSGKRLDPDYQKFNSWITQKAAERTSLVLRLRG